MAFRTTTLTEKVRSYYGTHLPQAEIQEDHNKNTTMSQYYSSLKRFVEFYFSSNQDIAPAESERQKNVVLKYCKMNWRRIGRSEDPDREDEAVQILLKIQPIHITRWLNKVAYNSIEPGPQDHPSHARANTLKAHKRLCVNFQRKQCKMQKCAEMHPTNEAVGRQLKLIKNREPPIFTT